LHAGERIAPAPKAGRRPLGKLATPQPAHSTLGQPEPP
jgi:hypothetical protein